MNRILIILLLFAVCIAGCAKTNSVAEQIKVQQVIDDKIITDYLTTKGLITKAKQVDSAGVGTGIYYIVDTLGTGNDLYTNSTQITVGYTGTLLTTGVKFISTDQFHPSYTLGATIRGWQLGIPNNVKKGGTIELYLPSHYAYGPYAQPNLGLPANAILIFDIKVYNITN